MQRAIATPVAAAQPATTPRPAPPTRRAALAAAAAAILAAAPARPAAAAPSLGKNRAVELAQKAAERRAAMKAKVDAAKTTQKVSF